MKTNYKKAIKALIKVGRNNSLFYYKTGNYYLISDGCCIITVPAEDFKEIPTYSKVGLIENISLLNYLDKFYNQDTLEATQTSLLIEDVTCNNYHSSLSQTRVFKLENGDLVPINNDYVEIVKNTIYQDNINYCNGLNTKTPIRYIEKNIDGSLTGFIILPINFDVKGKLEYMLGLN